MRGGTGSVRWLLTVVGVGLPAAGRRSRVATLLLLLAVSTLMGSMPGAASAEFVAPVGVGSGEGVSGPAPGSTSLSVTTSQAVPAGASVIVAAHDVLATMSGQAPSSAACSDSDRNSYYTDVSEAGGAGQSLTTICSAPPIPSALPAGSTITVAWTGKAYLQNELVQAFFVLGLTASPLDRSAAATGVSSSPSSGGAPASRQARELLFAAIADESDSGSAAGFVPGPNGTGNSCAETDTSSYTSLGSVDLAGAAPSLFSMSCLVAATGAYSSTASLGDSLARWNALLATYRVIAASTSTTRLSSSSNPSTPGEPVTFTATVTGSSPAGTVQFRDGGMTIGGCGVESLSGGTATCTTSALAPGSHDVTAAYGGDDTDSPSSSSTLTQTVRAVSSTALDSSPNPSMSGQSVTFTATVTGSSPSGTIDFENAGSTVAGCGARPLSGGTATCTTSALAPGSHSITAVYGGDPNNLASTSSPLTQTVQPSATPTPMLTGLRVSPHAVSITGRKVKASCVKPTRKTSANKHCRRAIKLKIAYTLNEAATVTFTLKRKVPGRRVKGRCVKPTTKRKHKTECSRLLAVHGKITKSGTAGADGLTFNGKIGGHRLEPGSYELTATPTGGKPQTVTFRIVR